MKKIIILLIILCCLSFNGCIKYGKGSTIGYITTVEDGIFWDRVWIRSDLESSQTDCYLINNDDLKQKLLESSKMEQRIELTYNRHLVTISGCSNDDEAISFKIVK